MRFSPGMPLALALGVALGTGITLTHGVLAEKAAKPDLPLRDLQTFVEILNRVKTDYVEPASYAVPAPEDAGR